MATVSFKVYGKDGHRQRESFKASADYDFSVGDNVRKITINNSDRTGTNEYTEVVITKNTVEQCIDEMNGQLSDGIFENSRYGDVITHILNY